MADSSDCRCVSDDGSCPHESFTKAKFQIYWHEIEHDIDNVLANYTRESIRDFIEIEKLKSVRTMSSLVNRLSRPNPDKNINKLRKVKVSFRASSIKENFLMRHLRDHKSDEYCYKSQFIFAKPDHAISPSLYCVELLTYLHICY